MGFSKGFSGSNKKAKATGRIEDGTYPARIVQIIDLGLQENEWQGETKQQPKVFINFEFPTERITVDGEDRPRWLGKEYTMSSHEKSQLYQVLMAADPGGKLTANGKKIKPLLGQPLMVTVGSTASGNAKIVSVARLMKGLTVGELENPAILFDLDNPDEEVYNKLPKWVQEKIDNRLDKDDDPAPVVDPELNDDNPF